MNGKIYISQEVKKRAQIISERAPFGCSFGIPIDEREKWKRVSEHIGADKIMARAEILLNSNLPDIDDELYFSPEIYGNTIKVSTVQRGIVHDFEKLCMAECMENKGRFLNAIEQYISFICTMKSWVNAGHDRAFGYSCYKEGCGLIDLYTSGIVWALITCDSCLGERLSDESRSLMRDTVRRRAIDVYERKLNGYTDEPILKDLVPLYWLDVFGNWIAVCSGAMTAAALYWGDDDKKAVFIAVYEWCMSQYIKSVCGGYCAEGLSYWNYGFSNFIIGADCVARATNGLIDLYTREDFAPAATFGIDFELTQGDYPAISDCMFGEKPSSFNLAYYKMRCGNYDVIPDDILTDYHSNFALLLFGYDKRLGFDEKQKQDCELRHMYEGGYDVLICRNKERTFGACIKGGTNQEPHNHNDLGTFVISVSGESLVCDVGYTKYLNHTFEAERYIEPALNSFGHNAPVVGGCLQGPEKFECDFFYDEPPFYAKVNEKEFSDEKDKIVIDLTHAYECKHLEALTRDFIFDRIESKVIIEDYYQFNKADSFETAFVTFANVEITDDYIVIRGEREKLYLQIPFDCTINITPIPGVVVNNHEDSVYPVRIGFKKKESAIEGNCKLVFSIQPDMRRA